MNMIGKTEVAAPVSSERLTHRSGAHTKSARCGDNRAEAAEIRRHPAAGDRLCAGRNGPPELAESRTISGVARSERRCSA